jgi:hypothetical protein
MLAHVQQVHGGIEHGVAKAFEELKMDWGVV